jgi:hypothetical protein
MISRLKILNDIVLNFVQKKLIRIKHFYSYLILVGFVIDSLTLPSPDRAISWIIGLVYFLIIGLSILLRDFLVFRVTAEWKNKYISYTNILVSFFMGSFLSFVFIYYFRSSDILTALPVLILLASVVAANELYNSIKWRSLFDTLVYVFTSIFYFIFLIPIFVGTVSDRAFVISMLVSLLYFTSFFLLLSYLCLRKITFKKREVFFSLIIFVIVIMLYFAKILPAVPLSLKTSGIYLNVTRAGSQYELTEEKRNIFETIFTREYKFRAGDTIYYFSSVHAPTSITTRIYHKWEFFDVNSNRWINQGEIEFDISGGRENGYRGYSSKSSLRSGKWRVSVLNADRRVIGKYTFNLKLSNDVIDTKVKEL